MAQPTIVPSVRFSVTLRKRSPGNSLSAILKSMVNTGSGVFFSTAFNQPLISVLLIPRIIQALDAAVHECYYWRTHAGAELDLLITRGARFFLEAELLRIYGEPIKGFIEKRLTLVTTAFLGLIVGGFIIAKYAF